MESFFQWILSICSATLASRGASTGLLGRMMVLDDSRIIRRHRRHTAIKGSLGSPKIGGKT